MDSLRGAGRVDGTAGGLDQATAAAGASNASAIMNIFTAVSEMMQSIGGSVENDQMLRLLVATMILMALLDPAQKSAESAGKALEGLGQRSADQSQFVGIYYSSTTITIQQTATSTYATDGAAAFAPPDPAVLTGGGQIDLSI